MIVFVLRAAAALLAQGPAQPDCVKLQDETIRHDQTLLRFDTMDPPGRELPAAEDLKQVFDTEGIPARLSALEPNRPSCGRPLEG